MILGRVIQMQPCTATQSPPRQHPGGRVDPAIDHYLDIGHAEGPQPAQPLGGEHHHDDLSDYSVHIDIIQIMSTCWSYNALSTMSMDNVTSGENISGRNDAPWEGNRFQVENIPKGIYQQASSKWRAPPPRWWARTPR